MSKNLQIFFYRTFLNAAQLTASLHPPSENTTAKLFRPLGFCHKVGFNLICHFGNQHKIHGQKKKVKKKYSLRRIKVELK